MYTTNHLYQKLNAALRADDRKDVLQYFLYLRLLLTALQKLGPAPRKLYRGVALDLSAQYKVGAEVTWWAVSSCTPELKVATSFSKGKTSTLFFITASTSVGIREMSAYKHEEEFLLAPGTQFKVTAVEKKPGPVIEIHMTELDQPKRVR